ncbi:MAG TPA: MoxR family ATPase [Syntrophales bacterium]|nr:MoxR family ATPase [Syntrophales bacterium]HPX11929.1 MoxR family ATPase [Syntrophales bacterium]
MTGSAFFDSPETLLKALEGVQYICSRKIATTLLIALHLGKPVLVEGPAGVGKTELAKKTAEIFRLPFIRLQCYEGLDESKALYEWKYGKQLLYTQILKDRLNDIVNSETSLTDAVRTLHRYDDLFFSPEFLEPRPLLQALQRSGGTVLLIDEIDKSDEEFEAFLLEILSDFQVSIPEIGTVRATSHPIVFLTSNDTRELGDALKRRCLHLYIPFPDAALESKIIAVRAPGVSDLLKRQLVSFIQEVRKLQLKKVPSISEAIDWARTLLFLHAECLSSELINETMNVFIKFESDGELLRDSLPDLMRKSVRGG